MNSIEALKMNAGYEKKIVEELASFIRYKEMLNNLEVQKYRIDAREKKILLDAIKSLIYQLKILNNSTPEILNKISMFKELSPPENEDYKKAGKIKKENLVSLNYKDSDSSVNEDGSMLITLKKEDRPAFLRELVIAEGSIKRLKKSYKKELLEKNEKPKKPSAYAKLSNRFFLNFSKGLIEKGYFPKLNTELRRANLPFLTNTYVSMAVLSSLITLVISIVLLGLLLFFNLSLTWPFFTLTEEAILMRFVKNFWIVIAFPIGIFFSFYFYPSTEKRAIAKKINQELPFVVIHMSAIAGSGIEPTEIFKIIVLSKEYPNAVKELKKLINQITLYGYDLVTALRNSARLTSSNKLAELYNGLATTISSGGGLQDFLDKRSETLIFDYRLERENSTKMAETFMNIYISVVIAAPMIMTILLVMINLTGMSFGLSTNMLTLLMVLGIALVNVVFLVFLHLKQPTI